LYDVAIGEEKYHQRSLGEDPRDCTPNKRDKPPVGAPQNSLAASYGESPAVLDLCSGLVLDPHGNGPLHISEVTYNVRKEHQTHCGKIITIGRLVLLCKRIVRARR
jgi:hypothetical protein